MRNMTVDEAYDFFVKKVVEGMMHLNLARNTGHLGYPSDYSKKIGFDNLVSKHEKKELYINRPWLADTNYFQKVVDKDGDYYGFTYQLKPNVDASEALDKLFSGDFTILECHAALHICYYYGMKKLLCETKGEEEGIKYFNQLFGSKLETIPEGRRLLIGTKNELSLKHVYSTNFDLSMLQTTGVQSMQDYPINALSFFITPQSYRPKKTTLGNRQIPPGFITAFENNQNYVYKHNVVGYAGGFNVLTYKHDDQRGDLYCGFGFNGFVTEKDILKELRECYNADPDNLSNYIRGIPLELLQAALNQHHIKYTISEADIPGLTQIVSGFEKEKLNHLLTKPAKEVAILIDNELKDQIRIIHHKDKDYQVTVKARMTYQQETAKNELTTGDNQVFLNIIRDAILTARFYAVQPKDIDICNRLLNITASNKAKDVYNNLRTQIVKGGALNKDINLASSVLLSSLKSVLIDYLKEYATNRNKMFKAVNQSSIQGLSTNTSSMFSNVVVKNDEAVVPSEKNAAIASSMR